MTQISGYVITVTFSTYFLATRISFFLSYRPLYRYLQAVKRVGAAITVGRHLVELMSVAKSQELYEYKFPFIYSKQTKNLGSTSVLQAILPPCAWIIISLRALSLMPYPIGIIPTKNDYLPETHYLTSRQGVVSHTPS